VIENANVTQYLLNSLLRPSMNGEPLNADYGVITPANLPGVRLEEPRLYQEHSRADEYRTRAQSRAALVRVVKPNEEVLRFVSRHRDAPVRNAKLPVQLISYICCPNRRRPVAAGQHHCLGLQPVDLRGDRSTSNNSHLVMRRALGREARNVAGRHVF
jgi:hypothetical protein